MSYEAVLPRIREKRRWPSDRALFYLIYSLYVLDQLAYTTVQLAAGNWFMALPMALYIWLYGYIRRAYRLYKRLEEAGYPVPPVPKVVWAVVMVLWVVFGIGNWFGWV